MLKLIGILVVIALLALIAYGYYKRMVQVNEIERQMRSGEVKFNSCPKNATLFKGDCYYVPEGYTMLSPNTMASKCIAGLIEAGTQCISELRDIERDQINAESTCKPPLIKEGDRCIPPVGVTAKPGNPVYTCPLDYSLHEGTKCIKKCPTNYVAEGSKCVSIIKPISRDVKGVNKVIMSRDEMIKYALPPKKFFIF